MIKNHFEHCNYQTVQQIKFRRQGWGTMQQVWRDKKTRAWVWQGKAGYRDISASVSSLWYWIRPSIRPPVRPSVHPSVRPSVRPVCLPSVQDALLLKFSLNSMAKWQKAVYRQWYPCPYCIVCRLSWGRSRPESGSLEARIWASETNFLVSEARISVSEARIWASEARI